MVSFAERFWLKTAAYGWRGPFKKATPEILGHDLAQHLAVLQTETRGHDGLLSQFLGPYRDQKKIAREKTVCLSLIQLGADLRTPGVMERACEIIDKEILQEILKRPYALDVPVNTRKETPLILFSSHFYADLALDFLRAGANVNAENADGQTALCVLAAKGYVDKKHTLLLDELLQRGANINHRDNTGRTPLYLAGEAFQDSLFLELLRRGADPLIENKAGVNIITRLKDMRCPGADRCLRALETEEKELSERRQDTLNKVICGMPVSEREIIAPQIKIGAKKTLKL